MRKLITSISLLLVSLSALALDSDRDQPIRIKADAAMVDEKKGTSIYQGNVVITQGTLQVTADEVEIFTSDSAVTQIIARMESGSEKLAHYEQQMNENREMVIADARQITYLVQEERLHLSGSARLQQVQDVFTGDLLYYDIGRGIVNLNSTGTERVEMTINPRNTSQ